MLIEQTHFPKIGPNWTNIAIGALGVITLCAITYMIVKHKEASSSQIHKKFVFKPDED